MDYEGAKAKLLWNWAHPEPEASEVYTDDAVVEFPQPGERFRGKENFSTWRGSTQRSFWSSSCARFAARATPGSASCRFGTKKEVTRCRASSSCTSVAT